VERVACSGPVRPNEKKKKENTQKAGAGFPGREMNRRRVKTELLLSCEADHGSSAETSA